MEHTSLGVIASVSALTLMKLLISGQPNDVLEKLLEMLPDSIESPEELKEYLKALNGFSIEKKILGRPFWSKSFKMKDD